MQSELDVKLAEMEGKSSFIENELYKMIQGLQLKISDQLNFQQEDLTEDLFDKLIGEETMREAKAYTEAVAVMKQQTVNDSWFS